MFMVNKDGYIITSQYNQTQIEDKNASLYSRNVVWTSRKNTYLQFVFQTVNGMSWCYDKRQITGEQRLKVRSLSSRR